MINKRKQIIEVVEYRKEWVTQFYEEAALIKNIFKNNFSAIHHIGSTAIPNMPAKPTIDILLEVKQIELVDNVNVEIAILGYKENNAAIVARTQAHNRKCANTTIDAECQSRASILSAQFRTWRCLFPDVLRQFAKLPDVRIATKVKHKASTLMLFGLFAFILKLQSRREMNRELTAPCIQTHLRKLFPGLGSIPHGDTLARFLENTNPLAIEKILVGLIKKNNLTFFRTAANRHLVF